MKKVLNHPLIAVKLISALFFLLLLMPQTASAQETPPYNPCDAVSSTSVCMDNSHSCDETQAACSTGYCWSAGAPSVNAGIPVGGLVENKVIEIGGTYVVTISATFKNCTFRMSGDSRIRIAPNGSGPINISFENCDIFGCDEMWQGIVVDATNAANNFTFRFLDGTIEDAYIGLRLDELKGNYSVADNSFRNNHIGISNVRQNGGSLNASIIRNHFFQSAELAERTGTLDDPFSMPDYPLAHAGVKYINVVSAIGALETVQTGNTTNIFECLQYGIVTENGRVQSMSNLFQIIGRFGIFSTDGAMRVFGCEFLISGITGIHAVGSELKVQKNTFNGVWREGVHSEQNLNSERITITEDNQFIISAALWINGIYVERPQATDGKHCVIDGNTFTVTSNPSISLYCILLEDFVNAKDEMEVSNNTMTINSLKGGVFAIQANMGSSDQLNVHDNTIHYGTIADTWASWGITLFAAGGQNLSNGNIIRDNTVTGINVDRDENALQCAFHIQAISGTEFCDNSVDQSYRGMHFVNSNDVDLRTTHFSNHTLGLHVAGTGGRIGQQPGRGNVWDLDTDACVDFAAQVLNGNPMNSRIIVTQGSILPWLPVNDKIDPDPTLMGNPNWFTIGVGGDDATCLSPLEKPLGRKLTSSEVEVISSTSTLSGVSLWDLKREAYTKLLVYPELRPTSSPEETFFNSLSGTLIDSLAQVIKQVHNGLSLSTGAQTDLDTYRSDMELDFEDLVYLDGTLDYSDMNNLSGTWFLQRDTLLQSIALHAANEMGLESSRNTQVESDLQDALAYNTSISTSLTYGKARKTFTKLLLSHLLFLPMTESLYDDALSLAQDDVENTGMATEEGLRFLGPCDQGLYLQREEYGQEERPTTHSSQSIGSAPSIQAIPNPTSGLLSMQMPNHLGGLLTVYDVHGHKLKALFVASSESNVSLDLSGFPNGIYWLAFSDEAGKVLSTVKVVVIH